MRILPRFVSKKWIASTAAALFMHGLILCGGAMAFVRAPQYGVESSSGGMEVYLTAALPATAEKDITQDKVEDAEEAARELDEDGLNKEKAKLKDDQEKKEYSFVNKTKFTGDGSSPETGENKTTFYSAGGGNVEDKPGYMKNPPPTYPQTALERGQQGLVLLSTEIDPSGRAKKVEIKQSSGFRLLDEAALKAVKKWKFEPAKFGTMAVESKADIPIRFVLEDELKRRGTSR